jgi:hypothetical protein
MTSAGIYRGFCLPWVVQYLSQRYFMDLDISRRLPRTHLCPFLSRLSSAECPTSGQSGAVPHGAGCQ